MVKICHQKYVDNAMPKTSKKKEKNSIMGGKGMCVMF